MGLMHLQNFLLNSTQRFTSLFQHTAVTGDATVFNCGDFLNSRQVYVVKVSVFDDMKRPVTIKIN